MMVRDIMKLPNEAKIDAKDCFLVGEGLGRFVLGTRDDSWQCLVVREKEREAVDIELKGFVSGEDGKQGMRGQVVLKKGHCWVARCSLVLCRDLQALCPTSPDFSWPKAEANLQLTAGRACGDVGNGRWRRSGGWCWLATTA